MTIPFAKVKAKWMKDAEFRREYEKLGPEFEIVDQLIRARRRSKLSQAEIAKRMGTTQSAVARLESGKVSLKADTIYRYAAATGHRVGIVLKPMGKRRAA
jgi:DNA-binding transcriptional regulator YiaG